MVSTQTLSQKLGHACNTLKSMSLVCQNAEDNAHVMVEICFRFDNFFQAH